MNTGIRHLARLAMALSLGLATGCAPGTRVVDQWLDPAFQAPPLRNVMVYRAHRDPVKERIWEDTMVRALSEQGVKATAFYTLGSGGKIDSAMVREALASGRIDGFLMIKMAGTRKESYYVPGTVVRESSGFYRDPFWGTWREVYREVQTPGYTETDLISSYDAYLFGSPNGEKSAMLWSARLESKNPGTPTEASGRATKEVIRALVKGKLI